MAMGTGFPDFVAFREMNPSEWEKEKGMAIIEPILKGQVKIYSVIGVECKVNGYLTKEEKEKCQWLLDKNIFSKILITSKGMKRGEIVFKEFGS